MDITPTKAILSIDDAKEAERFIGVTRTIERGDLQAGFQSSKHKLSGVLTCNGQNHFYLESGFIVYPTEQGQLEVHSSSQHPTETQHLVAEALDLSFTVDWKKICSHALYKEQAPFDGVCRLSGCVKDRSTRTLCYYQR